MSEESESVPEEIIEQYLNAEEWLEWFDHFKDERGDWILDNTFLQGVTDQFIKDKDKRESLSSSSEKIDEEAKEETEDEEGDFEDDPQPKDLFMDKLTEFTDFAKTYLKSKGSTLVDSNRPCRASSPRFWFYNEFREYLEKQGFMENMVDVLVKMFAMHPELPENPLKFIRDNYGISKSEEERLISEWTEVSEEMVMLEDEGKALLKRLKWRLKQPREQEETSVQEKTMSFLHRRKIQQSMLEEKTTREDLSEKESSSFHWVDSDPSSVPSSLQSTKPVGSEITLAPVEEEQQPERSVTPTYEYDDFQKKESSSSSLDIGSIELN